MVYVPDLNKTIFPFYIKPEEDELFSSWLCRLSLNHDIKTRSFVVNYFGKELNIWNRDIDSSITDSVISKFSDHVPINKQSLLNLTLRSYQGILFEKFNPNSYNFNILSLGVFHRKRKNYGQQCCVSCLSKGISYYKKSWRLATSLVCLECSQLLIDRCFNCNYPITFFRINMDINSSITDIKPLYLCSSCGQDLRSYKVMIKPSSLEIEYQKFIDNTIVKGYNNLTMYSHLYFKTFLYLAHKLRSSSKNNRFKLVVEEKLKRNFSIQDKPMKGWSLQDRKDTLPYLYDFFRCDTYVLMDLFREGNVFKSYIGGSDNDLPYWLEKLMYY